MNPTTEGIDTADRMLAEIQKLAPNIASRAAEFDVARRMPIDLVDALKSIGVFRMFAQTRYGGLELDYPAGIRVITELGKIDGALGWTAMIAAGFTLLISAAKPDLLNRIYTTGPDAIIAGSSQPAGTAEAVQGGWRVSGRWPFASGCLQADWILGLCVMTRDGSPLPGRADNDGPLLTRGLPQVRGFILPASEWQIEDTWHVAGLKGTGSNHISVTDKFVPAASFFDIGDDTASSTRPLYGALIEHMPLGLGAFFLGMAEGALGELVALANTGRRQQRAPTAMRDSEIFQGEIGRIEADLRAARAFQEVQVAHHWLHAKAGTLQNDSFSMQSLQYSAWMASTCGRIVSACFTLAGSAAVFDHSPLQRRFRDSSIAAQHFAAQQRNYALVGKHHLDRAQSTSVEQ